jgi:hypothetical protein
MTNFQKENFSLNSSIDADIKDLLPYFNLVSQQRMKKAILAAKNAAEKHVDENTDAGARHIFREFIPAYILNKNGFAFEYEKQLLGKKPDWVDESAGLMLDSYTYERGGISKPIDRITFTVTEKCEKYKDIIKAKSFRFMMAIYLDFFTCITLDECREDASLYKSIFNANHSLWAMVFFTETDVIYKKQNYGFLSLCRNSSFRIQINWPFETIDLGIPNCDHRLISNP